MKRLVPGAWLVVCLGPFPAQAVDYVWTDGAADGNWVTPGNWNIGSGYPDGADDTATITNSGRGIAVPAGLTVGAILIGGTYSGTNTLAGGCSASGYFDHDTAARCCVLYTTRARPASWTYDVAANEWAPVEAAGEQPGGGDVIGYYDPERDVLVHYNSKDVYVCRIRKPAKKGE